MDLGDDSEAIARLKTLYNKVKQMVELRSSALRELKEKVFERDIDRGRREREREREGREER